MDIPLKYRAWFIAFGLLFSVPTSYLGYLWQTGKHAKQQVNCIEDIYTADYSSMETIELANANFMACQKAVDPNKGTVPFLRDELKRAGH
ncbi:hypothetical protein [Xanthomonas floridensis]|uniref:Uncharacterized protein n=1 Tax=Xanthomonas floridensis TaxID=1843580 RepID=A0A1A9MCW2_9XANT|nr:hypothetical protein [Xanthomonas floridensis]MEA5123298.1 hypothetical protein [Xanthomonas floridensis]MEA5132735.1 hypothetical protein [Xanthomonas floridensis]OAG67696.1 hypothetical protein A7D17_16030 [Xanthomonas floridensis]